MSNSESWSMDWPCKICKFATSTKEELMKHYRLRHIPSVQPLPCPYLDCFCSFKSWGWSRNRCFVMKVSLFYCKFLNNRGRNIFFAAERRETHFCHGGFRIHIVIEQNILWAFKISEKAKYLWHWGGYEIWEWLALNELRDIPTPSEEMSIAMYKWEKSISELQSEDVYCHCHWT